MQARLQQLFVTCLAVAAVLLTLFTLYLCYAIEWRGPMRDLWEFIAIIEQQFQGHWDWQRLLEPYGGIHRILLPKLLFYLDYRFASGSNLLSLGITLCLHIIACGLLLHHLRINAAFRRETRSRQETWLLSAIVLLFFFSTTQIYNLVYNSDNQVVISNALAIIAACLFCHGRVLIANALILLACLSHSSSLMLLPAFLVLMIILCRQKKIILLQGLFSVVLLAAYVSGSDPRDDPASTLPLWQQIPATLLSVITQINGIARYIGLYLSSPSSRLWPGISILLSYLSIAYLFSVIWRVHRKYLTLDKSEIFFLCLALYIFFVSVITACGRQIYPNSAFTDRYQTLVMTYWPAMLILLYSDLKRITALSILIIPLLGLSFLLPHQYNSAKEMAWLSSRVNVAHTAATVGITDMSTVAATLSHPLLMDKNNLLAKHNDFLREYSLGYFSESGAEYFLNPQQAILLDFTPEQRPDCTGELLGMETLAGDTPDNNRIKWRLTGRSEAAGKPVSTVLIVDSMGQVIGLGRDQRPKGEFRPLHWRHPEASQWVGFIHIAAPLHMPLTFIQYSKHSRCELFSLTQDEMQELKRRMN